MRHSGERLDAQLTVKLSGDDVRRLDSLLVRLPAAMRHALARECMRRGMQAIEADPCNGAAARGEHSNGEHHE